MVEILTRDESPRQVWDQHQTIIDAVAAGEWRRAETAARRHITLAADTYIGRLLSMRAEQATNSVAELPEPDATPRRRSMRRRSPGA